jgi:KDO2-lipid IV(A) lauroyltransferase
LTRALQALEAAALWLLVELVRLVPTETASAIGGWLGATFGPWLPRSAVARDNLRRAFPETSAAEVEAIVRGMWSNLGRMAFEYPHLDRFRPDAAGGRVEIVGAEHLAAMRQEGRSVIMFSGHLANWELLGPTAAALGVHLNLFYRAPNNPYLGWLFDLRRSGTGEMLPKGVEGAKRALKLFKAGRHFGMLVDQKMNDGIPVRFFGRDAMTAPALAQFALRFHCPVLPARIERLPGARFRITILPPMTFERSGDTAADVKAAMTRVNAQLESWIRERPAEWLWLHRRWPAERRA